MSDRSRPAAYDVGAGRVEEGSRIELLGRDGNRTGRFGQAVTVFHDGEVAVEMDDGLSPNIAKWRFVIPQLADPRRDAVVDAIAGMEILEPHAMATRFLRMYDAVRKFDQKKASSTPEKAVSEDPPCLDEAENEFLRASEQRIVVEFVSSLRAGIRAVLAFVARQPRPITDAMVEAAASVVRVYEDNGRSTTIARAMLEAAEKARDGRIHE